jgi:hypothetical protein
MSDGTQINFQTISGIPTQRVENSWARVGWIGAQLEASNSQPRLSWAIELFFKSNDIVSLSVFDVTTSPVSTVIAQTNFAPKSGTNLFIGQCASPESADFNWIYDSAEISEKFFKIVLSNANGQTEVLYQPTAYSLKEKKFYQSAIKSLREGKKIPFPD